MLDAVCNSPERGICYEKRRFFHPIRGSRLSLAGAGGNNPALLDVVFDAKALAAPETLTMLAERGMRLIRTKTARTTTMIIF